MRSGEEARAATAPNPAIKQRAKQRAVAGTQALPVDASASVVIAHDDRVRDLPPESLKRIAEAQSKIGRPRIHPDRKAYKAAKQREYRQRQKEGK